MAKIWPAERRLLNAAEASRLKSRSYGLRVRIIHSGQSRYTPMNRRKKIKQLLEAHARKANAKLAPKSNKPKYISKADRAKLAADAAQESVTPAE